MITREQILKRASELQKQAERLQADLQATLGALQDCGYWLDQLKDTQDGRDLPETP